MNQLCLSLQDTDPAALKQITRIIAICIRNNMEDFHTEGNLSDEQMARLNPLIRNGIFDALFAIANCDKDDYLRRYIGYLERSIPVYWEEPELDKKLQSVLNRLQKTESEQEVLFQSIFLTEQYKTGNIYRAKNGSIQLLGCAQFSQVDYDDRKKHQRKITYHLHKEGYRYSNYHIGYIKN